MTITIMVEGNTEQAFTQRLRSFLRQRLAGRMPKLDCYPYTGRIPKGERLKKDVERVLSTGKEPASAVIALTDVYTGTNPPDFQNAADAKEKMHQWVGPNPRFHPHAAQYEFEAWLLPFWDDIQRRAGHNRAAPGRWPEQVNHHRPPSHHLKDIFHAGKKRDYNKIRDAHAILHGKDLLVAANACPESKAFLNTILMLCQAERIA